MQLCACSAISSLLLLSLYRYQPEETIRRSLLTVLNLGSFNYFTAATSYVIISLPRIGDSLLASSEPGSGR